MTTITSIERAARVSEPIVRPTFFGISKEAGATALTTVVEDIETPKTPKPRFSADNYAAQLMQHSSRFDRDDMYTIPGVDVQVNAGERDEFTRPRSQYSFDEI